MAAVNRRNIAVYEATLTVIHRGTDLADELSTIGFHGASIALRRSLTELCSEVSRQTSARRVAAQQTQRLVQGARTHAPDSSWRGTAIALGGLKRLLEEEQ